MLMVHCRLRHTYNFSAGMVVMEIQIWKLPWELEARNEAGTFLKSYPEGEIPHPRLLLHPLIDRAGRYLRLAFPKWVLRNASFVVC